jgi:hypothetical protein
MKGVILDCLKNMVTANFGNESWKNIMLKAKVLPTERILISSNYNDRMAINLIDATCQVLNLPLEKAAIAFGDYWMEHYVTKIYAVYMKNVTSSKDLLLKLDSIHTLVTNSIPNSRPPKFTYQWLDAKTLIMSYQSNRNLIDLFIGLAKSVGKFYKEELRIKKINSSKVKIVFL